ncbi:amidohydrolase family protein [Agaribacter flavus]|uniref:Amidohydrolase family protein n=1 Tax=Agaribacter flavus TaxID=1902781 RepID=A0ABV7FSR0_9ALTE
MKVDAHHHLWQYQSKDYGWISESQHVLKRHFLPSDLRDATEKHGINATVAVQARQSLEETRWLLSLAKQSPLIKGVVGWIDIQSGDLAKMLEEFASEPLLKGFRHVVQDEPNPHFMLSNAFIDGLHLLHANDYAYDILVFAHQLPQCIDLLPQLPPDMRLVVDHIAKPEIAAGTNIAAWQDNMSAIAAYDNVWCKLSGMVTEAKHDAWTEEQLLPYIDFIFKSFGPERIMYGSDWPVCLLAAEYKTVINLVEDYVATHYPSFIEDVMGTNATRFYHLTN